MRVVLVPGFTQTASSWDAVAAALRERAGADPIDVGALDVVTLDVPLHDTFAATAAAIGAAGGDGLYVGYSMGGRLCLRLGLDRPDLVRALVLVSASPGIADPAERRARVAADEQLALEVERDGVDAFLDRWLAQPMFASVPADAPGLSDRRRLAPAHLARCVRVLGTGAMEPLWDRLPQLRVPVTLVTGTRDAKFDGIAREMAARMPAGLASHVRVEGGHALSLEAPAVLASVVADAARAVAGHR